jgi:hypothetical protein
MQVGNKDQTRGNFSFNFISNILIIKNYVPRIQMVWHLPDNKPTATIIITDIKQVL